MAYQTPPGYVPPPGYLPPMPTGPAIASLWRRFFALLLDCIVVGVISLVIAMAAGIPDIQTRAADGTITYTITNSGWGAILIAVVSGIYFIGSWVALGGTPGQRVLALHVYAAAGPQALGIEAAAIRWALLFGVGSLIGSIGVAAKDASGALGFVQLAWVIVLLVTAYQSPMKQGLHDKYANSVVVKG